MFVTVTVVDKIGNLCETATNQLYFFVKGKGDFSAVFTGSIGSSIISYQPAMKLSKGQLVVLVQSTLEAGSIELVVEGKGIKPSTINLISESKEIKNI